MFRMYRMCTYQKVNSVSKRGSLPRSRFCGITFHSIPWKRLRASQSPRSIWTAPRIETSGRLQNRKSVINSDWPKVVTERPLGAWPEVSIPGADHCRRIVGCGDENGEAMREENKRRISRKYGFFQFLASKTKLNWRFPFCRENR